MRIITATMLGVILCVMGALFILEYYHIGGGDSHFLSDFYLFAYSVAAIPPFVPAALSSALFTRGKNEGAVAGFITYLLVVGLPLIVILVYDANMFACETGICGFSILLFLFSPLLGALGGFWGGAIGGWRAKRRARRRLKEP